MQTQPPIDGPQERHLELMLRIERRRRGELAVPATAWAAVWSTDAAAPLCAACGGSDQVSADPRCGEIPFCGDCSSRTRDLTDWDDLGCGD